MNPEGIYSQDNRQPKVKPRRKFPLLLVILFAIFLCWLLSRYLFIPESRKVDRVLMTGIKAIEQEDLTSVMSIISNDYEDDFGMDYERLERWFNNNFKSYDGIKILIPVKKIRVSQSIAVCSLRVSIQARNPRTNELELIYGYSAWGDEIILDLIKSDGKWQFTSAHP